MKQRPPKQSKFVHEAPAQSSSVMMATRPFDRAMREAEAKWGIDRLPGLVSPDTARKWGVTWDRFMGAIDNDDADETAKWAAIAVKAIGIMGAEADAAGHPQMPSGALVGKIEGRPIVIMPDDGSWQQHEDAYHGHTVVGLNFALAAVMDRLKASPAVQEVTKHFPDATVRSAGKIERTVLRNVLEDDLPF